MIARCSCVRRRAYLATFHEQVEFHPQLCAIEEANVLRVPLDVAEYIACQPAPRTCAQYLSDTHHCEETPASQLRLHTMASTHVVSSKNGPGLSQLDVQARSQHYSRMHLAQSWLSYCRGRAAALTRRRGTGAVAHLRRLKGRQI